MAAAAEPAPEKPAKGRVALGLPGRRILMIGGAAMLVLAIGGGAAWFFLLRGHRHGPAPVAASVVHEPAHVWKAGTVVVNIAGTGGRRYLRTTIELGVAPKAAKHVDEQRALLVDTALGVLGAEPLDRLLDPGQREPLRAHLKERLNETLGRADVTHVFLTEFVVQ
jgi:flagellar protein FliL